MIEGYDGFDINDLTTEFNARAIQSKTTQELAQNWAESFAKLAISSSVGIMEQVPITQTFSTITAVPRAPFILLGIAAFLYGAVGLGLMMAAIRTVVARPDVCDVQARMEISGLVSATLEHEKDVNDADSLEKLPGDNHHVGIYKTASGGYKWEAFKTV